MSILTHHKRYFRVSSIEGIHFFSLDEIHQVVSNDVHLMESILKKVTRPRKSWKQGGCKHLLIQKCFYISCVTRFHDLHPIKNQILQLPIQSQSNFDDEWWASKHIKRYMVWQTLYRIYPRKQRFMYPCSLLLSLIHIQQGCLSNFNSITFSNISLIKLSAESKCCTNRSLAFTMVNELIGLYLPWA